MRDISLRELLEAGCHFGHQTTRWHPKAAVYIYGSKDGVHIIDLAKTKEGLVIASDYLKELARSGKSVLFVGSKRQGKPIVSEIAKKVREEMGDKSNFYYLLERWPGGLLTNFDIIKKNNLDTIVKTRDDIATNTGFATKKEKLLAQRKLDKYDKLYGGLVGLTKLPEAVIFLDIRKEAGAVKEAVRAGVKIIAITDTNVDPNPVDLPIPANDDAVGSIKIISEFLADSWVEGLNERQKEAKSAEEAKPKAEDKKTN